MDVSAAAAASLQTRVLAMTLTDVRASVAVTTEQSSPAARPADVILDLSVAAQQLLKAPGA
jgi:D-arabinose 5-phosphate isomerase GutQ